MDDDVSFDLQREKFSKSRLLHRWTMSFRNDKVEDTFYKSWYLIDPFPFENPNAAILHQGVFRVIRFAVIGMMLTQAMLGIQDYKLLGYSPSTLRSTYTIRYGIVIPAYLSASLFMYFMGKVYYKRWLSETNKCKVDDATKESLDVDLENGMGNTVSADQDMTGESLRKNFTAFTQIQSSIREIRDVQKDKLIATLVSKGGYVRSAQIFSAMVVLLHVGSMAYLLVHIIQVTGKRQNVYFMGFLNAVLFAHRSGFRVRFVYATHTTMAATLAFIIASSQVFTIENLCTEYSCYVVVVLILGMLISREEESLRRSFFILKSIRTLEFEEWFGTVLRVQGWVRAKMKNKLQQAKFRIQHQNENGENVHIDITNSNDHRQVETPEVLVNISAHMTHASKLGVYSQLINMGAVVVDVFFSSIYS